MKYKITSGIDRISLHDSAVISSQLTETNIFLKFDWAAISYFEDIINPLVLGHCELKLIGIQSSFLERTDKENKVVISFPTNFPNTFNKMHSILENKSPSDKVIIISGLLEHDPLDWWISWYIEFDCFEFSWDNHITVDEWKKGALPD